MRYLCLRHIPSGGKECIWPNSNVSPSPANFRWFVTNLDSQCLAKLQMSLKNRQLEGDIILGAASTRIANCCTVTSRGLCLETHLFTELLLELLQPPDVFLRAPSAWPQKHVEPNQSSCNQRRTVRGSSAEACSGCDSQNSTVYSEILALIMNADSTNKASLGAYQWQRHSRDHSLGGVGALGSDTNHSSCLI